ncbi:unnamed protein product [Amaranthus hypochondriacus]
MNYLFPNSSSLQSDKIEQFESRHIKLEFEIKLPGEIFTGKKVEAEGSSPIKIQLVDTVSGELITDGPLSSKKVEIVVVKGDFDPEQQEDWTKEEFCKQMLSKRYQKSPPLLNGRRFISLRNGIGFVENIVFTDNSSWGRSKMFRLGAKMNGEEQDLVREAITNPFKVKDRRGENYQKCSNPSLEDEVWRLSGIAKDGKICQKLEAKQIFKVKDLITCHQNDESVLPKILSPTKFKAIIKQATACLRVPTCVNRSELDQLNFPCATPTTFNQNINPCSNMPNFCLNEEQEMQMPEINEQDNYLVGNMLQGSCNNVDVSSCNVDDYLMVEQDNDFSVGGSYVSSTGMLPSNSWIPNPKSS